MREAGNEHKWNWLSAFLLPIRLIVRQVIATFSEESGMLMWKYWYFAVDDADGLLHFAIIIILVFYDDYLALSINLPHTMTEHIMSKSARVIKFVEKV